ncbi:toxin-antitoxin system, toxin component [Streptomyces sp. XM83C]|uniref:Toxin-antitoxin system, toxin component n=1 Tax=Streptomyces thermocoprophilus TaxID=78356 RepID=A0ABV5VH63_9ACTN|nr:toxin-antitoxin system, toxin component [Streptomyces sp. XM83C]MCK1820749.1 toxin-antitoxin system, toxin component [Streptomyces sp. XM83C]
MGIGKEMRRLCGELVSELDLPAPARPDELYTALCGAMSRRRGRPVRVRMSVFPPGTASGLWLDMADQDLVVVEERTAPEHQLVILGHELWHMQAGHGGHHVDGATVAARLLDETSDLAATVRAVAARTRFDLAEERDAERFGLLLASKCRTWLAGAGGRGAGRGTRQAEHLAGRIGASLGYRG